VLPSPASRRCLDEGDPDVGVRSRGPTRRRHLGLDPLPRTLGLHRVRHRGEGAPRPGRTSLPSSNALASRSIVTSRAWEPRSSSYSGDGGVPEVTDARLPRDRAPYRHSSRPWRWTPSAASHCRSRPRNATFSGGDRPTGGWSSLPGRTSLARFRPGRARQREWGPHAAGAQDGPEPAHRDAGRCRGSRSPSPPTRQRMERLCSRWVDSGHMFTTMHGTPYHAATITRAFKAALTRAGLPECRFHDLRHAAATFLLAGHDPGGRQAAARP
jgi:hypothetical protein